jgi:hypothetical protein
MRYEKNETQCETKTVHQNQVLKLEKTDNFDVIWWRNAGVKSEPDWGHEMTRDGVRCDQCGSFIRILYSFLTQDFTGRGQKDMHVIYCGECAKKLSSALPHKVTRDSAADFTLYFGKYKGQKISAVPKDYLDWALKNLTDDKIKKKIEVFLAGS